jgi:DNA-binding transcriptional LysR family regulator
VGSFLDHTLLYFVEVAERGSFSAAARALRISQPSLSVAVRKLEDEVGAQLLHRDARGVSPTAAGELLLARAREATQALRAARAEIDALGDEPRGAFVLGVHESLGTYLLPGFMARFLERHPHVELSLLNDNSREVERAVLERRADVGLVVNPGNHPDTVVIELFSDIVTFVGATRVTKRYRNAKDALARLPIFQVPAIRQTGALLARLDEEGIAAPRRVDCSSMELVKSLVLDGAGIGILPYRVATHGVAKGRLATLGRSLPVYEDRITMVRRADAPITRGMRALLDALTEHGRAMPAL